MEWVSEESAIHCGCRLDLHKRSRQTSHQNRRRDGLSKLTTLVRERHFARLIKLGALARLSATGDYAVCNRFHDLVGQIMGLTTSKVEKAVKEEIQRISQTSNRLPETELVKLFGR